MAKPRRAVRRRRANGRILLSATLIAITAVATVVVWQLSDSEASVALSAAEESAVIDDSGPPSTGPSGSPADEASDSSSPSLAADPTTPTPTPAGPVVNARAIDWGAAVAGCQHRVRSRDTVIARAATGIEHWHEHIQAQTDADAGRITPEGMKRSFMRTRLEGPSDVASYSGALDIAASQSGSCGTPKGAPASVAATMSRCAQRMAAQRPVLVAGAAGMDDWSAHLAFMRKNKTHPIDHAQTMWIDQWRAAPPHIAAFENAQSTFGPAPSC